MMNTNTNQHAHHNILMAIAAKCPVDGDAFWRGKAALMGASALRMVGVISSLRDEHDAPVFPEVTDSLESANRFIGDAHFRRPLMDKLFERHQHVIDEVARQFWVNESNPEHQALAAVWAQLQPEVSDYLASLH